MAGFIRSVVAIGSAIVTQPIVKSVGSAMIGVSGIARNATSAPMGFPFLARDVEACRSRMRWLMGVSRWIC